jgi:hypothetical protein
MTNIGMLSVSRVITAGISSDPGNGVGSEVGVLDGVGSGVGVGGLSVLVGDGGDAVGSTTAAESVLVALTSVLTGAAVFSGTMAETTLVEVLVGTSVLVGLTTAKGVSGSPRMEANNRPPPASKKNPNMRRKNITLPDKRFGRGFGLSVPPGTAVPLLVLPVTTVTGSSVNLR